ncbi:hypothetical protein BGZ46_005877, partial [Entomortierella lignicola]
MVKHAKGFWVDDTQMDDVVIPDAGGESSNNASPTIFDIPAGQALPATGSETSSVEHTPEPTFTVVEKRRRHLMMVPVAAFGQQKMKLTTMVESLKEILAKRATIVGNPHLESLFTTEDKAEPHVIFEVGSHDQLTTACRGGLEYKDNEGNPCKTTFMEYTNTQMASQMARVVQLINIAWNTTVQDVYAAMGQWGTVTSVNMKFNSTKSMKTAKVIFAKASSVEKMRDEGITAIAIGRDSASVTQIGATPVTINRALTMKLANLPLWFQPIDVLELFRSIPAPNAEQSLHSISMPVNYVTKRRNPEAFIYFTNKDQWERVRNRVFTIEGKNTVW